MKLPRLSLPPSPAWSAAPHASGLTPAAPNALGCTPWHCDRATCLCTRSCLGEVETTPIPGCSSTS